MRTTAEWADLVARNPFLEAAGSDPAHLVAFCLRDEPTADALAALRAAVGVTLESSPDSLHDSGSRVFQRFTWPRIRSYP